MGAGETGLRQYRSPRDGERYKGLSEEHTLFIDRDVSRLIHEQQARAAKILADNKDILIVLRDEVIAKKTIEAGTLKSFLDKKDAMQTKQEAPKQEPPKEEPPKEEKKPRSRDKAKSE